MKSCLFPVALFAAFLNGSPAQADERVSNMKNGVLTVYTGDYQATFSFGHRWNLSSLTYGTSEVIPPGGANQFNVRAKKVEGGGQWYGGIANPEEVKSVTLYVDDAPQSIPENDAGRNGVIPPANSYTLEKTSKVGPYNVTLRTVITPQGLSEEVSFHSVDASEQVEVIYNSRFAFGSDFKAWFATVSDGFEEEGDFGKEGATVINQATSSIALFDPRNHIVALLKTEEEPVREGNKHFIWHNGNRLAFHSRTSPDAGDTEPVVTKRHLSVWSAQEGEDWREQVRAHLSERN